MDNSVLLIPATAGVVFVLAGAILYLFPPKKINSFYGYRTRRSKKSPEHWKFAQVVAAKELLLNGSLMVLISAAGTLFELTEKTNTTLSALCVVGFLILLFFRIERSIQKKLGDT
jgi:uncharacterized membrane protein